MKEAHVTDGWLRLYHRLPAPIRSLAANIRGLRLQRFRYGPETESLVAEALERDNWSADRWSAFREERLAWLLNRAATQVPFYRMHWEKRRRAGDRSSWERIENWPLLHKETVRQHPHAFVADDCDPRRMIHYHTSGTTGTPLHMWQTRSVTRHWFALFEARVRRWNQVSIQQPWVMQGGAVDRTFSSRSPSVLGKELRPKAALSFFLPSFVAQCAGLCCSTRGAQADPYDKSSVLGCDTSPAFHRTRFNCRRYASHYYECRLPARPTA